MDSKMYQSFCNEFMDQYATEITKYHKVKHQLQPSKQVMEYAQYIATLERTTKDLLNAVKFKIPACDQLLPKGENPIKTALEFIQEANLPYPSIAIELEAKAVDDAQDDIIILAKQEDDFIKIYAFNRVDEWKIMEQDEGDELIHVIFNRHSFEAKVVGFDPTRFDSDKKASIGNWFLGIPTRAVLNLLCTLSCSNAHIEDHPIKPSKLKNDMRKKKKKLPFFEFKILTIDTDKNNSNTQVKTIGSHASPRIHLRRGHIRKLPSKNVWVNACVVGDKSKGIIQKDYLIK